MCWDRRITDAVEWLREQWHGMSEADRNGLERQIMEWVESALQPYWGIAEAIIDPQEALRQFASDHREYIHHPDRLWTKFVDRVLPSSRFGELARTFNPGSEGIFGTGEEISRPVILVPGMVGTRLFRSGSGAASSSSIEPDRFTGWLDRQFHSDDSDFLRPLPRDVREVLQPMLDRMFDRQLYDPNAVWDPDTPPSLARLMNRTARERGELFCPDVTACEPASDFALPVAEAMTLRGMFSIMFGLRAEERAREAMRVLGVATLDDLFQDSRYEQLREQRRQRGWHQAVWAVSEYWLLPLERTFNDVIYAFGYDWRQPLLESVDQLVRKIERVKEAHGGKSPILVTHSFGGLLARAAAKRWPENVGGIVQVFSPTAGSVKPYTNFKRGGGGVYPPQWQGEDRIEQTELFEFLQQAVVAGFNHFDPTDLGFGWIQGWDATQFATTSSGVYGAYSLLPNNLPRFGARDHWLKIENDSALTGLLRSSRNVFDLYRQFDQPWGLLDGAVWKLGHGVTVGENCAALWEWLDSNAGPAGSLVNLLHHWHEADYLRVFSAETLTPSQAQTVRDRVNHGIDQAEALAQFLGDWVHPNTWSIDAHGKHTDLGFNIRGTGDAEQPHATHRIVTRAGDGSLEVASARALNDRLQGALHFPNVSHAHAMRESAEVRAGMIKYVYFAMMAAHRAESGV
jgi:pimeloyl-ACP methyl ester carboxylesterase